MAEKGEKEQKKWPDLSTGWNKFKEKFTEFTVAAKDLIISPFQEKPRKITYFRRLICCKLNDVEKLETTLLKLKEHGFTDITASEFIGKRGSRIMLEYLMDDNIHRIHLRVYTIDNTSYFLIHREPVVSPNVSDLMFHIKGFFDRVNRKLNEYNELKRKTPGKISIKYDEKVEMSDYEQGCKFFKEYIKNQVPNLNDTLDFYLDDSDFLAFSLKFGNVSKILPVEMLFNDFNSSIEKGDSREISKNIVLVLELLGFKVAKMTLDGLKMHPFRESIEKSTDEEMNIEAFHASIKESSLQVYIIYTTQFLELGRLFDTNKVENNTYILSIYQGELPQDIGKKFLKKIKKKNTHASYISLTNFKAMFKEFLDVPFSSEKILKLIESIDTITNTDFIKIHEKRFGQQDIIQLIREILDFLDNNQGWHDVKRLKEVVIEKFDFIEEGGEDLDNILDLLRNPILDLVESKDKGKKIKGIENKEELKLKLNKLKKIMNSIDFFNK